MNRIRLRIVPQQPLLLGSESSGNYRLSYEYVPGSTVRGALASKELVQAGAHNTVCFPNAEGRSAPGPFHENYLQDDAPRFGYFWPVSSGAHWSAPAPVTTRCCKDCPDHPLFDTLLDEIRARLDDSYKIRFACPECKERTDRIGGVLAETGKGYTRPKVAKSLHVRVGLNRHTETASDGFLYTLEVVEPHDIAFVGEIRFPRADGKAFVNQVPDAVSLGGSRSRGCGRCRLEQQKSGQPSTPGERLERFQKALKGERIFSLTLRSPGLFRDGWGMTTGSLVVEELYRVQPQWRGKLTPLASFTRQGQVGGWSQAWGLPKPVVPATAQGSVFVFRYDDLENNQLSQGLEELEVRGVGERTREGFGEVSVCDEIHLKLDGGPKT